jgi:hypothetical protein
MLYIFTAAIYLAVAIIYLTEKKWNVAMAYILLTFGNLVAYFAPLMKKKGLCFKKKE